MAREDISFAAKKIMLVLELDPRRIKLGYERKVQHPTLNIQRSMKPVREGFEPSVAFWATAL